MSKLAICLRPAAQPITAPSGSPCKRWEQLKHALHRAAGQEFASHDTPSHALSLTWDGLRDCCHDNDDDNRPLARGSLSEGAERVARHHQRRPSSNGRPPNKDLDTVGTRASGGVCHPIRRATDTQASRRGGPMPVLGGCANERILSAKLDTKKIGSAQSSPLVHATIMTWSCMELVGASHVAQGSLPLTSSLEMEMCRFDSMQHAPMDSPASQRL